MSKTIEFLLQKTMLQNLAAELDDPGGVISLSTPTQDLVVAIASQDRALGG